jgi:hypothetical protein
MSLDVERISMAVIAFAVHSLALLAVLGLVGSAVFLPKHFQAMFRAAMRLPMLAELVRPKSKHHCLGCFRSASSLTAFRRHDHGFLELRVLVRN